MGRIETLELASGPYAEDVAQVGTVGYYGRAHAECRAFRAQLLRTAAAAGVVVPDSVRLYTKSNAHDYGSYYEVAVKFPEDDEAAAEAAYWFEANGPEKWDAEALTELGLIPDGDADAVISILLADDVRAVQRS